jgi:hypothetical protein
LWDTAENPSAIVTRLSQNHLYGAVEECLDARENTRNPEE